MNCLDLVDSAHKTYSMPTQECRDYMRLQPELDMLCLERLIGSRRFLVAALNH